MKNIPLLIFTLLLSLQSFSQHKLTVKGKCKPEKGLIKGQSIILVENGDTLNVINDNSNFSFNLNLDSEYYLTVLKSQHVTKQILINTNFIPNNRKEYPFEPFTFNITLFPNPNDSIEFVGPVGIIGFSKEMDDFDYKTNYTKK
jgi:hypothetical protein